MDQHPNENRLQKRFDASVNIQFSFTYDLDAEIRYQKLNEAQSGNEFSKHRGKSKNISSKGICVKTPVMLNKGDKLLLEILMPGVDSDFVMQGEVRWSAQKHNHQDIDLPFEAGIEIQTVKGVPVSDTIYFDEDYHVYWSVFLESVLGNYRKYVQQRKI